MNQLKPALTKLVAASLLGALGATAGAADVFKEFDLGQIAAAQRGMTSLQTNAAGGVEALVFAPRKNGEVLEIWNSATPLDWTQAKCLVVEVWHTNQTSAILNLDFHRQGAQRDGEIVQQGGQSTAEISRNPRISPKIGVLPALKTQVIFPLSYLDGQTIFMTRFPRQLKGTVSGSRLDPKEVGALRLRLSPVEPPNYASRLTITRVYLAREIPAPLAKETTPYVDEFGQWARKDWPGKVHSETELKAQFQALEAQVATAAFPSDWSQYGGWKAKSFKATGFFRTHHDGRRWWLVDPEGYAHISAGMDCVGSSVSTSVRGQEDLFAQLLSEGRGGGADYFRANLARVYGNEWRAPWEKLTTGLLKQAGFNTIANWSDVGYARAARLPYVLAMRNFPRTASFLYRDFPDVYAEEFKTAAGRFARQLDEYKNDPFLMGYFLSNEPNWAFGKNNLAFEMFATAQASATKRELVSWLQRRYQNDLKQFNEAWKLALGSFDGLLEKTFRDPSSPAAEKDLWEFSGLMAERYVAIPCDAVKAVDPNHLNLGMRYAWISSDLLYHAGQRFDVFSINGYSSRAAGHGGSGQALRQAGDDRRISLRRV